jgi:VWFA-related protein
LVLIREIRFPFRSPVTFPAASGFKYNLDTQHHLQENSSAMSALMLLMLFSFQASQSGPDSVIQRASVYAQNYLEQMGSVIGEERYLQEAGWEDFNSKGRKLRSHRERQMVSDFLTVPVGNGWVGFRHVREVDGVTLDPLYKGVIRESFNESTAAGREQLQQRLLFESIRYNIGDFARPANLPTFALELLAQENMKLLRFVDAGQDKVDGIRVMKFRFTERMPRSFVISTGIGPQRRVSIFGSFSIEAVTGRILETEIGFADPSQPRTDMSVHVRFRNEKSLGLLVPVVMEEHFHDPMRRHEVDCTADYQNFRHFETAVQLRDPSGFLSDAPAASDFYKRGEDSYALRVSVPLVNVEAWVTATSGSSVTDLAAGDFVVLENKTEQTITNFSSVSTPYDVLLLFDHSGSTVTEWQMMQRATQEFFRNLRPQDRAGIANFDTSLRTLTRWTDGREQIAKTIAGLTEGRRAGGTAFYRSVEQSLAAELLPVAGRRRAIVILSDGRDNGPFFTLFREGFLPAPQEDVEFQQMITLIRRERIPIYVVAVNSSGGPQDEINRLNARYPRSVAAEYLEGVRNRLETIAELSGGRVRYADRLESVIPLYKQISTELGSAYSIGYVSNLPTSVQGFREITINTHDKRLHVVQSRAGYRLDNGGN